MKTKTVWVTMEGNYKYAYVLLAESTEIVREIRDGYLKLDHNTYELVCSSGFKNIFGFLPKYGWWYKMTMEVPE